MYRAQSEDHTIVRYIVVQVFTTLHHVCGISDRGTRADELPDDSYTGFHGKQFAAGTHDQDVRTAKGEYVL